MTNESLQDMLTECEYIRRADDCPRAYVLWDNLVDICVTPEEGTLEIRFYEGGFDYTVKISEIEQIGVASTRFIIITNSGHFFLYRDDCVAVKEAIRGKA